MLFHTWTFAVFFAIVYPLYRLTKGTRWEMGLLLASSYIFYAGWNPLYLGLIIYVTVVDYSMVAAMDRCRTPRGRKLCLAASVASNLGVLGFFKYAGFWAENLNAAFTALDLPLRLPPSSTILPIDTVAQWINGLLGQAGVSHDILLPVKGILLPVGISFFTFQSMSYVIDFYRGAVTRERSLVRYGAFIAFFTQLVAGPIERASNLLQQLRHDRTIDRTDVAEGLSLFAVGFFKKAAMADYLSLYVDKVYANPGHFEAPALALATFAFAWQIYFDFAGYTDMARGLARMMGFRLMLNFNNPYLADGLGDFWTRWHISLSTWFKDYVYIPLGGNRGGTVRTYVNMVATMLVSGLWHGANWTYIVWGALHGAGRAATRAMEDTAFYRRRVPRLAKQVGVFGFVSVAWIFFRAATISDAWLILRRIVAGSLADPAMPLLAAGLVLVIWAYQYVYESRLRRMVEWSPVRLALAAGVIAYLATFAGSESKAFIYFQF
jgi:alginate O-acetyltransferase complex protein AlgI